MIRETSLTAFESIDITARQSEVLEAIRSLVECTDVEIAMALGWPINRVTGRRGELVKDHALVESCGIKTGPTGRPTHIWRISQPKPQPIIYTEQGALFT